MKIKSMQLEQGLYVVKAPDVFYADKMGSVMRMWGKFLKRPYFFSLFEKH